MQCFSEKPPSERILVQDTIISHELDNKLVEEAELDIVRNTNHDNPLVVNKKPLTNYFLYYFSNNSLINVTKKRFCSKKGKVTIQNNKIIKIIVDVGKRKQCVDSLKKYKAQSLFEGIKSVFGGLAFLGQIKTQIDAMTLIDEKTFLIEFLNNFLCFYNCFSNFNIPSLVQCLLNVYLTFTRNNIFKAQSFDALFFSSISTLLPPKLWEVIKRLNVFSNVRLLDDPSCFYNFILLICDYFRKLIEYIPYQGVKDFFLKIFDFISSRSSFFELRSLSQLFVKVTKNTKLIVLPNTRADILARINNVKENSSILEWSKRSATVSKYLVNIQRFEKLIISYDSSTRVEPNCFVFEGKPGVFKSVYMSKLLSYLKKPCYYHCVKNIFDGKDFYDTYNNEEYFCMDDVGQQGVSQWRTIINFVSPIKLPLDCAAAELKDTKFFNSQSIFLTTNCATNLNAQLTKQDGISDITALYRRLFIFQFNVYRNGSLLQGSIDFLFFLNGKFVNQFPNYFDSFCRNNNLNIPSSFPLSFNDDPAVQEASLLAWFADIIDIFSTIKKEQQLLNNQDNTAKIDVLRIFKAQSDNLGSFEADVTDEGSTSTFVLSEESDEESELYTDVPFFEDPKPCLKPFFSDTIEFLVEDSIRNNTPIVLPAMQNNSFYKKFFDSFIEFLQSLVSDFSRSSFVCILSSLFSYFLGSLVTYLFMKPVKKERDYKVFYAQTSHPSLAYMQQRIFKMRFVYQIGDEIISCNNNGIASGNMVVTNSHTCPNNSVFVTIYKSSSHILVDNLEYVCVYRNDINDVAVFESLFNLPSPFKSVHNHFHESRVLKQLYIIDNVPISLDTLQASVGCRIKYTDDRGFVNVVESPLEYNYEGVGKCGSVLYDLDAGICGLHVAGLKGKGVGIIWDQECRNAIRDVLSKPYLSLDLELSSKELNNVSGVKLEGKYYASTPKTTHIKPTPLHGIFPINREPANLQKYGPHTVKDVFKKSLNPSQIISNKELEFAGKVLQSMIGPFTDLSDYEVVKGNEFLSGINKDSSNGYHCLKDKTDYFDFEKGISKDFFLKEVDDIISSIRAGVFPTEKFLWCETLKDEVRDLSKEGEPRSFRVSTVHLQYLTKKLTGNLASHVLQHRDFTGIVLGANPVTEWPKIYNRLLECEGKIWASDIKKWDGSMLPQVQQLVSKIILQNYKGLYGDILEVILATMFRCLVIVNDDLWMTTHSMPSGSFLTALINSLVNKCYTAMWFYRYAKEPTVKNFYNILADYVLGDDKVIGVIGDDESPLNAITFREFCLSIGLDCTDSFKQPVVKPYDDINSITFLKRYFRYHPKLCKITCPLDLKTLDSTISWYDSKKSCDVVLKDKLHSLQREYYLHYDIYHSKIKTLQQVCLERGVPFTLLPEEYLLLLYEEEPHLWNSHNVKYD